MNPHSPILGSIPAHQIEVRAINIPRDFMKYNAFLISSSIGLEEYARRRITPRQSNVYRPPIFKETPASKEAYQ